MADEPRFRTAADRLQHEEELNAILFAAFAKRDSQDWAQRLTEADVMNSVVFSYSDYLDDRHAKEVGSYDWLEHPIVGNVPVPGVPGAPESRAESPEVGQHSIDVLQMAGLQTDEIERLAESGAVTVGRT